MTSLSNSSQSTRPTGRVLWEELRTRPTGRVLWEELLVLSRFHS